MNTPPRLLAIGDTVVDAFIELIDAHVSCKIDHAGCELSMRFGDKIPYADDYILYGVGNPANAAVSCARLGIQSSIITHLGADDNGAKTIAHFKNERLNIDGVVTELGQKTNYHYVLWYRPERTILVKHENYNYNFPAEISNITTLPDWVYFSSLAAGTEQYHADVQQWLQEHPDIRLTFQPNTFQMKMGTDALAGIYQRTELFFANVDEGQRILGFSEDGNRAIDHIKALLSKLYELGPKIVTLTDGPKGAYTYDGTSYLFCPMYPDTAPPLERTGVGDAYASTFTTYYAQGKSIHECMLRAPINSMNVVQYVGAQKGLLTAEELEAFYAKRPPEYQIVEL